jgi:hypothetical protein
VSDGSSSRAYGPLRRCRIQYEQRRAESGTYVLRNTVTGRVLLASAADLGSLRSKLEFARSTNSPGALDRRLARDLREFGIDAFALEVLDVIEVKPAMTPAQLQADLRALEELWREKLADTPQY